TTGTIKMRATFDNPSGALFPQQFVNVRLLVDTLNGVTLAPNAAVQLGPSGNFVYLLNDDGAVSKRDVVSGPTDGKVTTITKGLAPGDKVVIDGVDRLKDGAKVRVVDNATAEAAQGQGQDQAPRRHFNGGGGGEGAGAEGHHHRHGQGGQTGGGSSAPGGSPPAQGAPAQ